MQQDKYQCNHSCEDRWPLDGYMYLDCVPPWTDVPNALPPELSVPVVVVANCQGQLRHWAFSCIENDLYTHLQQLKGENNE